MAETTDHTFTSADEWFDSGGVRCAARVYRPSVDGEGRPVVVMAHGFGGVRALRLYAYAERFAAAGYVVLVFDYRGFGESEGEPRQLLSVRMQHDDWRAALGYARSLDGVDPHQVVAWGTSFSGGHVIALAGRGEPLAAIIAQVPHVSGPAAVRSTGVRASLRVAGPAVRDLVGSWLGRRPVQIDSVNAPGHPGMMTTPDAQPGMLKLIRESGLSGSSYPQTVAARVALTIGSYSPGRLAGRIECPALVQIVSEDAITPRPVAEAAAPRSRSIREVTSTPTSSRCSRRSSPTRSTSWSTTSPLNRQHQLVILVFCRSFGNDGPMARPRTVQDDNLLTGLTAVFRATGYDGASISSLSAAVGLQSASLYHRFPNGKTGLALAVLDQVEREFEHVLAPLVSGSDPAADVAETARRLADFYANGRSACLLESMTLAGAPAEIRERATALAKAWVGAMTAVSVRAGVDPTEAERRGVEAFTRIEGALVAARVLGDPTSFVSTLAGLPDLLTSRTSS